MSEERRVGKLPCQHSFVYIDVLAKVNIIHCTTCNWFKEIKGRPIRKTDLSYQEFIERRQDG